MTDAELAQVEKWQSTSEGKADLALHALGMVIHDLEMEACTRDGFRLIRTERWRLIEARDVLELLIAQTAPQYVYPRAV
jgi:hypothetical protein